MKVIGISSRHWVVLFAALAFSVEGWADKGEMHIIGVFESSSGKIQVPCGAASTGLNECKDVKERSVELVTARAKEIVEDWYRGKLNFYSRTCSLTPNIFTNGPEVSSNHLGQSCGDWSAVRTTYRVQKKKFSVRVDSTSTIHSDGDRGDRERAYTAGVYVQAVDCVLKKINNEIRSGTLNIRACQSMGASTGEKVSDLVTSFNSFASHVKGANAREVLNKCDGETQKGNEFTDGQGKGEALDQVNCRLVAQRAATETLFQEVAVCELMMLSKAAFDEFRLDVLDPGDMRGRIDSWAKACQGCGSDNGCQNTCYQNHYTQFFKSKVEKYFGRCE
jgi:hypothetical protein